MVRVPARLMATARRTGRELGKSDPIDAVAVARAALREPGLPVARLDGEARRLRLLVDHREDMVGERTRMQSRLRWHVHELLPGLEIAPKSLGRLHVITAVIRGCARSRAPWPRSPGSCSVGSGTSRCASTSSSARSPSSCGPSLLTCWPCPAAGRCRPPRTPLPPEHPNPPDESRSGKAGWVAALGVVVGIAVEIAIGIAGGGTDEGTKGGSGTEASSCRQPATAWLCHAPERLLRAVSRRRDDPFGLCRGGYF